MVAWLVSEFTAAGDDGAFGRAHFVGLPIWGRKHNATAWCQAQAA